MSGRPRIMRTTAVLRERTKILAGRLIGLTCRWSSQKCGVALVYHSVGEPPGDPQRELVPALSTALFAEQLRHLQATYRLVSASELVGAVDGRRRGQRFPVAITFDDDLRSHRDVSMPALHAVGAPATFFLTGATLQRPHCFWWQLLQRAVDGGHPLDAADLTAVADAPRDIHAAARRIEAMSPADRETVTVALRRCCGPDAGDDGLRYDDVRALAQAGFEIGFHTLRHDALPALDDVALERAMSVGRDKLAAAGGTPSAIAYPHGQAGRREAQAAWRAGYACGFTTSGAPVSAGDDPYLIGRCEPHATSPGSFRMDLTRRFARACRDAARR
jgi:peptidoglycan/xylan/chitin deacetylase (PgdA/CDA1 family)